MRFMQAYAGEMVCAPSRAALMTGQHNGYTFIRGNKEIPYEDHSLNSVCPSRLRASTPSGRSCG